MASILRLVVLGLGRSPQMQFPSWRVILRKFMLHWLKPSQPTCFALVTLPRVYHLLFIQVTHCIS